MNKILVTGAGGPAGRALGLQFAELGPDIEGIALDIVPATVPGFAATDLVPRVDDPAYARGMVEAIGRHQPDLVIPTVQDELPQVAVLAELFGSNHAASGADRGQVVISSPGPTAVAADKLLTMWALDRAGAPIPRYAPATEVADAAAALDWADGPVVVKPRLSRGGRGVRLIESAEGADWGDIDDGWILQSFAGGTEYSPQLYRSPTTGETTVVVLEKTELKQGRVGNAAQVLRLTEDAAPDVVEVATQVAEALDLVGPTDMDLRRDDRGRLVVLEVNSRFGANSAHAPELLHLVLTDWLKAT